ncbi:MAG TPA: alcohol dehydrogenase catalytic domain-containing protein [Ktedonobacteraceae bacterium]
MKAAVVHEFTSPLRLEEIAKPEPEPGKIVVKIEASGLCHTDIHAAHGDWPVKPTLPLIPGHEGVGIVESVGVGVTEVKEGTGLPSPGWAMPVVPASTVSLDGRPCASSSSIPAIFSLEPTLNMLQPSPDMSPKYRQR